MPPTMTPVKSSNIEAIGHDGTAMYVKFKPSATNPNGLVYKAVGVPQEHFQTMLAHQSPGGFYHSNLKSAFRWERADES